MTPTSTPPPGTYLNPTCFGESDAVLEKFFLLCCFVPGKRADQQQTKLDAMLRDLPMAKPCTPLARLRKVWTQDMRPRPTSGWQAGLLRHDTRLGRLLGAHKAGQYSRLLWLLCSLLHRRDTGELDLRTTSREDMVQQLPGLGLKTASFFILHSRPDAQIACLDTHVLRYLREHVGLESAPAHSPSSTAQYMELEGEWLQHCRKLKKPSHVLDFEVWLRYSGHQTHEQ